MTIHDDQLTIIRESQKGDNQGLLNLTALSPMMGRIAIRTDRNPDFFNLLELRGESKVFVARNQERIIGSISASCVQVYINGNPEFVYYIGDFKIHPDYRRTNLGMRLVKTMWQYLVTQNADILFCTMAYGNDHILPFFRGRAKLPLFKTAGVFNVYQLIPRPMFIKSSKYSIREMTMNEELVYTFNNFNKKYQLGPVNNYESLKNTRIYSASLNGKIVAMVSLFDPGNAKQNTLIKLPGHLNCFVKMIRWANRIFPLINLPKINQPIKMLYIKTFCFEKDCQDALHHLIRMSKHIAFKAGYSFLTIGLHEKDPVIKSFGKYPKFTFKSVGMITSLRSNKEKIHNLIDGVLFEDYSLV